MIALPPHDPCGREGLGTIDQTTGAATCTTRRKWSADPLFGWGSVDSPGCGMVFPLCDHGQRACSSCAQPRKAAA